MRVIKYINRGEFIDRQRTWVVVGGEESSSLFFFLARLFSEKNENKITVELPLSDQLRHV